MKLKKIIAILTTVLMLTAVSALAEDYGSAAVTEGQTYTLEEMLTLAIQDEYMAQAEYALILQAYGEDNAFANIIQAEATHIEELQTLFTAHGFEIPENTAAERATLPASLQEAYETGVTAEVANIAMYQAFLAQTDVPEDVQNTFTDLQKASESHLEAFNRNAEKDGNGDGNGSGNGKNSNDGNGEGNGNGNGKGTADTGNGELTQTQTAAQDGTGDQTQTQTQTQTQAQTETQTSTQTEAQSNGNGNGKNSNAVQNGSDDCNGSGDCDGDCDEADGTQQQGSGRHGSDN